MSNPFLSPFDAPALIARHGQSSLLTPDGELLALSQREIQEQLRLFPPPLLVHGPATLKILNLPPESPPAPWFDLLELFLFVHPARSVTPTPRGLALELDLIEPKTTSFGADMLYHICEKLLSDFQEALHLKGNDTLTALLSPLEQARWSWAGFLKHMLAEEGLSPSSDAPRDALKIWRRLPQWEEEAPRPAPGSQPVAPKAARLRLTMMLGDHAEPRPGQADFASAATQAFAPRDVPNAPHIVLAEAGTGTGKTLGYIAPASLWAEKNDGPVWISTYTRHLQRQIEQELTRLYPEPTQRRQKAVIRKGRENYLCLLNFEDIVNIAKNRPPHERHMLIPLALLSRWADATSDGDVMGGDLPGWFGELFHHGLLSSIADRRGECIHSACPHYQSCFIEHSIRRARHADLVIANHALVLSQAAWNALLPQALAPANLSDENGIPTRYVFDEGHHIPAAADSAFSLTFSGLETAELRRWILGAEGGRSRARGLRRRMDDILERIPALQGPFQALIHATQQGLPRPSWSVRLQDARTQAAASSPEEQGDTTSSVTFPNVPSETETTLDHPAEAFLFALDRQLQARVDEEKTLKRGETSAYDRQECDLHPTQDALLPVTEEILSALQAIAQPLDRIITLLSEQLEDQDELDAAFQQRLEATIRSLHRRAFSRLQGWITMLRAITTPPNPHERPLYIDFIRRERLPALRGMDETHDITLNRHWVDPTMPFASTLQSTAHGFLVTSATLRDRSPDETDDDQWHKAEERLGTTHFLQPPFRASLMSPFDYAHQTRAYIITDLSGEIASLARAFQRLFETSGGGALGLFTAIRRLKEVHKRINEPLGLQGIPLFAQHIDAMDNATLVDVFRTEQHSCLLGTDAMRDGVDVPGEALRMVAFERTPWPRPDILHRERRRLLSGGRPRAYDDHITRMRLRQAFGRLIRRTDDYGVFVMLDNRMPSRLLSAFPEGVPVQRLSLEQAIADITIFLKEREATRL
ncbi:MULTISPECIES: ATP-dependent DNA helicase [unclassified Saccharibacter]|uniref:ATP-dependent DNA helicase n=1 Tax=unclassified Saccharibacter TaxID=2648722 RepID=UPI0013238344|nr:MULTISPECIES: ATP-dependent DNA helicase [unclassified Saccharibacter]MXV36217.1 ATP-dependent DNA helicase [Saccharibacter sp. EH611]MXV57077.1 ATP-dependent DNA helicase [Saccharibacter sp. EH70]MXV66563.1 ATP-dependent DNA helicase [Saccharibacter sp. EH60]